MTISCLNVRTKPIGAGDSTANPDWQAVEEGIEKLRTITGMAEIFDESHNSITISSERGEYFLVQGFFKSKEYVLVDIRRPVPDHVEFVKPIDGNECLEHNTIIDLDAILTVVKACFETGEFNDSNPYSWVDLYSDTSRFDY
jgi:hypothetical protein